MTAKFESPIGRLWPLAIIAPLLGACASGPMPVGYGYAPPPPFRPPPPAFRPGMVRPPPGWLAAPEPRIANPIPLSPPAVPEGRRESPAVVAPPAIASKPAEPTPRETPKPPEAAVAVRPRSETHAELGERSPTCGYWRLGCGILWR